MQIADREFSHQQHEPTNRDTRTKYLFFKDICYSWTNRLAEKITAWSISALDPHSYCSDL